MGLNTTTSTGHRPPSCNNWECCLDLPAIDSVVLQPSLGVVTVRTGIYGPLGKGTVGLTFGRSSLTLKGIHVHPGVIDCDYENEIQVMIPASNPYTIQPGDKIAQLLILPYIEGQSNPVTRTGGFGSTGKQLYWQTFLKDLRPKIHLKINNKSFIGLLDTGADVAIISEKFWPSSWPVENIPVIFTGLGSLGGIKRSQQIMRCEGPEDQITTLKPYVANIAINLWGRDLLQQWGAYINIPSISTQNRNIMCAMGYDPLKELDKTQQGNKTPLDIFPQTQSHKARISKCILAAPAREQKYALSLKWFIDEPIWIEQRPLSQEKLAALKSLASQQLEARHIEPSTSPWNSPVFVIEKKSGKWRMLTDLRAINKIIQPMGALQPGLPTPAAIPRDWKIIIVDLKDCFFSIPLSPKDSERFAFSVPVINHEEPISKFQRKVLPQGILNSPSLCQLFVAKPLRYLRSQFPHAKIIHYMDEILLALPERHDLHALFLAAQATLSKYGLLIAEDKIQFEDPLFYLGQKLVQDSIMPQNVQIRRDTLHTLNDFQKLLGDINCVMFTHLPTWDDCQQLLRILFTTEERERIQLEASKLVPGDDGQPTSNPDLINAPFPLTRPPQDEWDYNTAEASPATSVRRSGFEPAINDPCRLALTLDSGGLFSGISRIGAYHTHIRSHSGLPGPLAEGNAIVDSLLATPPPRRPCNLTHLNAKGLSKRFSISLKQAREIITHCPTCGPIVIPLYSLGVNPRGQQPNDLWQMDVTHVPQLGRLAYVRVSIDTYTGFIWATPLSGEKMAHVIQHLLEAFATMGLPRNLKTDNSPAHTSHTFLIFCQKWGIHHTTGIPYNPQGQGIIERANRILKTMLRKQKQGDMALNPKNQLMKALFTLNFLDLRVEQELTAAVKHHTASNTRSLSQPIFWKMIITNGSLGTPKTSTTLFIAMVSVLILTVSTKENHTYWAYIPNPPLNRLITWDDPSFPVYVSDSVRLPEPYDNRGPFKPEEEGKIIPEYSVGADGPLICFGIGEHCVTFRSQAWIAKITNGTNVSILYFLQGVSMRTQRITYAHPPKLPRCQLRKVINPEEWVNWELCRGEVGRVLLNTSKGSILNWASVGSAQTKYSKRELRWCRYQDDIISDVTSEPIVWHEGAMTPPSPRLPDGPIHSELWKIGTGLLGMTTWKGHLMNISNKFSISFRINETHKIQAC
ncbi:pok5_human ame: full=herv-provirus, partial [Lynx pardinus]